MTDFGKCYMPLMLDNFFSLRPRDSLQQLFLSSLSKEVTVVFYSLANCIFSDTLAEFTDSDYLFLNYPLAKDKLSYIADNILSN